jgi:hypothetical protein
MLFQMSLDHNQGSPSKVFKDKDMYCRNNETKKDSNTKKIINESLKKFKCQNFERKCINVQIIKNN